MTNEASYDCVVTMKDTGVIRSLPIDGSREKKTEETERPIKADNSTHQKFGLSASIVGPCNLKHVAGPRGAGGSASD